MCRCVSVCGYMHMTAAPVEARGIESAGAELQMSVSLLTWMLEPNLDPLEEYQEE